MLEVEFSKSRCPDGVWGARCLLGINTCEGRKRKQGWAEVKWRSDKSLRKPWLIGGELVSFWPPERPEPADMAGPLYPCLTYLVDETAQGRAWPWQGGSLQLKQTLKEVTAGGCLLVTFLVSGQQDPLEGEIKALQGRLNCPGSHS